MFNQTGELSTTSTNDEGVKIFMGKVPNDLKKLGNSQVGWENVKTRKRESSRMIPDQDLECDKMNVAKRLRK